MFAEVHLITLKLEKILKEKAVRRELKEYVDELYKILEMRPGDSLSNESFEQDCDDDDDLIIADVLWSDGQMSGSQKVFVKKVGKCFCVFPTDNGWSLTHLATGERACFVGDIIEAEALVKELEELIIPWEERNVGALADRTLWNKAHSMCSSVERREPFEVKFPGPQCVFKARPLIRKIRFREALFNQNKGAENIPV